MCSSDSIDRSPPPGAAVPVHRRLAAILLAAALLLAGCGLATPSPSTPAVLGTVRVSAVRSADDNQLFLEAKPRARLWTTNGPAPVEWGLSIGSATAVQVPVGSYTLSTFAVYMSDTIVCSDNTNGAPGQTCFQPTAGTSLTCDLPVVVAEGAAIEATYQLLRDGHCRLDAGPPSAGPAGSGPSASPGQPDPSG